MALQQRDNSVIFKDPEDADYLRDLTYVGTLEVEDNSITITQSNHCFAIADVICYNLGKLEYQRALAVNTVDSEICGVVKEVIDSNSFVLVTRGKIDGTKYSHPEGSDLWLSEVSPGHITSIEPTNVFRKIGAQLGPGSIEVSLDRGFTTGSSTSSGGSLEPYTKEELDEIIANIKSM